ncbi:MAG: alpha/beta hydrolase family protein [Gemmatimonadaceae bacterium]
MLPSRRHPERSEGSAVAVVLFLALLCAAKTAGAQEAADRGAIFIHRGADTVVTDRFIRSGDTLKGSVQVKGQPRIDYLALLGPNETVRSLTLGTFPAGASVPTTQVHVTMKGDSVIAETPTGVFRIKTETSAIPMFNNALALTELFTRRAKASGGVANIPYFATNGGATIDVAVRASSADSMLVTIARQVEHFKVDARGRILGGTIAGSPLEYGRLGPEAAANLVVALRDSSVAPKADYSAPPGAPYTAEEVRINGPGGVLGGTLTLPKNARGPMPAVVTITGSGQQDRDEYIPFAGGIRLFRQVADTLSRRGIAVLRLDDRGIGASAGDPRLATSADFADDIRAGLAYLRTRRDIDGARLGLVGHSEGGAIAPMIAATDPKLKAIVVMAGPGESGLVISMAQNKYILDRDTTLTQAKRDSALRAARAALDPAKQTVPWIKFWMSYDPAPIARRVKAATLILQGANDRQVPMDQAEKLAALIRAGGNKDVTVRIIPTTNHLFVEDPSGDFNGYDKLKTNQVAANVLGPLADWLVLKLGAK